MTWRDVLGSALRPEDEGRPVTLAGWVSTRRDHGGLVFVDLRDEGGIVQVVVNPEHAPAAAEIAHELRNEFVVRAVGAVVRRSPETVNPAMTTGEIEVQTSELEILSRSTPLPFQLDEEGVDETLRIRYRWLDLRREKMQRAGAEVPATQHREHHEHQAQDREPEFDHHACSIPGQAPCRTSRPTRNT